LYVEIIITTMVQPMFLFALGAPEIILIVLVVVLLFGGRKIPELMRGLGKGMKEFKSAQKEDEISEKKDESK
jgi:sec-independent protein translocase protein TatA